MQEYETFWWPDPVGLARVSLTPQLSLQPLVFELDGLLGVDEITRRHPTAGPRHSAKIRERIFRPPLLYVQLMEEAGGVDEVEGSCGERHPEDVSCEKMDRGHELRLAKGSLRLIDTFRVHVDGGDATAFPYPLAEAFDPERRGAPGVEYVEVPDVPEEVELAVAEGDEVVFELIPLFRRQGVTFV
jgi:hypothetical protein